MRLHRETESNEEEFEKVLMQDAMNGILDRLLNHNRHNIILQHDEAIQLTKDLSRVENSNKGRNGN
jgi:hypothetical protein